MKKTSLYVFSLLFLMTFLVVGSVHGDSADMEKIKKLHDDAIVIDAHAHAVLHSARKLENLDLGIDNPNSQIDFIKMKKGGVDAVFITLPILTDKYKENPSKMVFRGFDLINEQIAKYSDIAGIAKSVYDIKKLNAQGKRAVLLTIEYPGYIEGCLEMVDLYKKLGVTSLMITRRQEGVIIGHEEGDEVPENPRLSEYGKKLVKRMNDLGIVIDITHFADSLQKDVLATSSKPIIASHSNARGVADVPRNIPDDILKMIADSGGAVMVTFYPGYINIKYSEARKKAIEEYNKKEKALKETFKGTEKELEKKLDAIWYELEPETVSMEELIDHIDYIVKLVGTDHVGIGSDYGGTGPPKGLESMAQYPNITKSLVKRGYSEQDIKKILGGNLLRIIKEVQSKAK